MKKHIIPVFKFLLLVSIIAIIAVVIGKVGSSINYDYETVREDGNISEIILPRYKDTYYNYKIENDCTTIELQASQAEVVISKPTDVLLNPYIEIDQFSSCIGNEVAASNLTDKNLPLFSTVDNKLKLSMISEMQGFNTPTIRRIVRLYINEDYTYNLNLNIEDVKLTVLSEFRGSLNVNGIKGDINCRYINGLLNVNLDRGSTVVQDGILSSKSDIKIKDAGIINVKANLHGESGLWDIGTEYGSVSVSLNNYDKVIFDVSAAKIPEELPKGAEYIWNTNNSKFSCVKINNFGGVVKIT